MTKEFEEFVNTVQYAIDKGEITITRRGEKVGLKLEELAIQYAIGRWMEMTGQQECQLGVEDIWKLAIIFCGEDIWKKAYGGE